jgi:hypothetical protein
MAFHESSVRLEFRSLGGVRKLNAQKRSETGGETVRGQSLLLSLGQSKHQIQLKRVRCIVMI